MKCTSMFGFVLLLSVSLTFCGVKQEFQSEFPQEIKSVFFRKKLQTESTDSVFFYIEFKKPLLKSIVLNTVYFRSQESTVKQVTQEKFTISFTAKTSTEDFIMDRDPTKEYGNNVPDRSNAKYDIQDNEAVVKYTKDRKTYFFIIKNCIEKS